MCLDLVPPFCYLFSVTPLCCSCFPLLPSFGLFEQLKNVLAFHFDLSDMFFLPCLSVCIAFLSGCSSIIVSGLFTVFLDSLFCYFK